MLKTQLHSKLNLSHLCRWQDSEDILTGDFFGVLDYLPRQPYLRDFLECVEILNDKRGRFELAQVDWEKVEMLFWTRCPGQDESTEPDVVLVSNRWVIVVEVKLGSGFGKNQPWREYQFGRQTAENRGLSREAVHYVIVSRARISGAQVFGGLVAHQQSELELRTLWFRWLDAVTLLDGWLRRHGEGERRTAENEIRMLDDLLGRSEGEGRCRFVVSTLRASSPFANLARRSSVRRCLTGSCARNLSNAPCRLPSVSLRGFRGFSGRRVLQQCRWNQCGCTASRGSSAQRSQPTLHWDLFFIRVSSKVF